jgi:predicted transposase/invertase (TIGR01784 family)
MPKKKPKIDLSAPFGERYINLFTDFGFKKIFGEEENKDLLINFLNALFADAPPIKDLTYLQNEHRTASEKDRRAIFDLYCENEVGEKFIVELQRAAQENFADRSLYYSTFAIQEQAKTRNWNFELKTVYVVAVMNFELQNSPSSNYLHQVGLLDKATYQVFNPHLQFVYLEVPKFEKTNGELNTRLEKWVYNIKNLHKMKEQPLDLKEDSVFDRLYLLAEYVRMSEAEKIRYRENYKIHNDLQNTLHYQFKKGREEGREEGRKETILSMAINSLHLDIPLKIISKQTQLSIEELEQLAAQEGIKLKSRKKKK